MNRPGYRVQESAISSFGMMPYVPDAWQPKITPSMPASSVLRTQSSIVGHPDTGRDSGVHAG